MSNEYHAIQKRIDMDLLSRSSVAIVIYCLIFPAIFYPFDFYEKFPVFSWTFTIAVLFVCVLRLIHRVCTHRFYDRMPRFWIGIFTCFSLAHGSLLGGLFGLIVYNPDFSDAFRVAMVISAGMASGAISSLSPNLILALLYPQVLLLPAILATFYSVDQNNVEGWIILLFLAYLTVLTLHTNREYLRTFSIEEQLERQKKELETLSRIDALTGIYNRGYFNTIYELQWDTAVRNNVGLTLMLLDVDHFKNVNDTYGHPAGDECLARVAKLMDGCLKRKTDISCRFGGEEFASLLGGTPIHEAKIVAENIRHAIESTWIELGEHKFKVTISIGIASMLPKIGDAPETLIDQADRALYRAKKSGRNCVKFYSL